MASSSGCAYRATTQAPAVLAAQVLSFLGPHPGLHVDKAAFAEGMSELTKCLRSLCRSQLQHHQCRGQDPLIRRNWTSLFERDSEQGRSARTDDALRGASPLAAFLLAPDFAALSATYGMPLAGERSAAARGRAMRSRSNPGASFFNKVEVRYFAFRE